MIEASTNNERNFSAMSDSCDWNVYCTPEYFAITHYSKKTSITHQIDVKEAKELIELLQASIEWITNAQATTK